MTKKYRDSRKSLANFLRAIMQSDSCNVETCKKIGVVVIDLLATVPLKQHLCNVTKESGERPQWKCDLSLLMGKLVGTRDSSFDEPLEDFIDDLLDQTKSQIVEQILGMESMKEEEPQLTSDLISIMGEKGYEEFKNVLNQRNELRLQIKEEINKL